MVQAAKQGLGEWTSWLDDDVISNLERSLGEVPDVARVLLGLAELEGSWGWSRYSIGELGPAYRMIEIAAQLIGKPRTEALLLRAATHRCRLDGTVAKRSHRMNT